MRSSLIISIAILKRMKLSSSKHVVVAVVQAVLFSDENIFLIYLEMWERGFEVFVITLKYNLYFS